MTDVWKAAHFYFPRRATLVNKRNIVVKVARCAHRCAEAQIHDFSQCRHRKKKKYPHYSRRDMR